MKINISTRALTSRLCRTFLALQDHPLMPWALRRVILKGCGIELGEDAFIEPGAKFMGASLAVGPHSYINTGLLIDGLGSAVIGSNVRIGPGVKILTSTHEITDIPGARASVEVMHHAVIIEDGVWLGAAVIVMPGCRIATGCVIGAGALVTKDTEPNGLYLGIPAKLSRLIPVSPRTVFQVKRTG